MFEDNFKHPVPIIGRAYELGEGLITRDFASGSSHNGHPFIRLRCYYGLSILARTLVCADFLLAKPPLIRSPC